MRYLFVFGALGALVVSEAVHQSANAQGIGWLPVLVEVYVAASLLVLALAYGLRTAGVPVEQAFNHRRWARLVRFLFWPYQVFALLVLRLETWITGEPAF